MTRMFTKEWLTKTISNEQFVSFFFSSNNSHLCQQAQKTLRSVLLDMGVTYFDASHQQIKEGYEQSLAVLFLKYKRNELKLSADESLFEELFREFLPIMKRIKLDEQRSRKQQEQYQQELSYFVNNYRPS